MDNRAVAVVCALVSASLVAGHYHIPTVIMDNPTNSACPPDSYLDAVRNQLNKKNSDMLQSTCGDSRSGWKQVAYLNMTDPALLPGDCIKMTQLELVEDHWVEHLAIQLISAQMAMHTLKYVVG